MVERREGPGWGLLAMLVRFLTVGVINTLLTFMLYQILILLLSYRIAYTVSFAAGIAFAAAANAKFVFGVRLGWVKAFRFAAFYLVSYTIGLGLLTALVRAGVSVKLAPLIFVPLILPVNFIGSRAVLGVRRSLPK